MGLISGHIHRNQLVWYNKESSCATKGDRLLEIPKLFSSPSESARREIAAYSVIVAGRGIPRERPCRQAINDIYHPDQGACRKLFGPSVAELIVEDQPKPIIQIKIRLEAPCGVHQKPAAM